MNNDDISEGENVMVRCVISDPSRTPEQVIEATGCRRYKNEDSEVVATMPRGIYCSEEVEVVFFHLGVSISGVKLEREYEKRGLVPADPYLICEINEDDSAFAETYSHGTYWRNEAGELCYIAFGTLGRNRSVRVGRRERQSSWNACYWFAGLKK